MPYTKDIAMQVLRNRGEDPNKWNYDETTGEFIPLDNPVNPASSIDTTTQQQTKDQYTRTKTFWENFKEGAAPTAAGMVGGAATARGIAPLVASMSSKLPGWGKAVSILAPIAGGLGTAMGAASVQSSLESPERKQMLGVMAKESPYVSALGNLASAAPVAKIDPRVLSTAGAGLRNLIAASRSGISAPQVEALANVGLGSAANVGQEAYNQVKSGEFDPKQLALQAVGGALFNNPRKFVPFAKPQTVFDTTSPTDALKILRSNPTVEETVAAAKAAEEAKVAEAEAKFAEEAKKFDEAEATARKEAAKQAKDEAAIAEAVRPFTAEGQAEIAKATQEKLQAEQLKQAKLLADQQAKAAEEVVKAEKEKTKELARLAKEQEAQKKLQAAQAKDQSTLAEVSQAMVDERNKQVTQDVYNRYQQPEGGESNGQEMQGQETLGTQYYLPGSAEAIKRTALLDKYNQVARSKYVPRELLDWIDEKVMKIKGYKQTLQEGLTNPEGQQVKGMTARKGETFVDPMAATIDTAPHEGWHQYAYSLLNSPSASDNKFARRMYDKVAATKEFKAYAEGKMAEGEPLIYTNKDGQTDIHPVLDEYIAQRVGDRTGEMMLGIDKGLLKDFWARVESRLTKGSADNIIRVFGNKFFYDQTNRGGQVAGISPAVVAEGVTREQPLEQTQPSNVEQPTKERIPAGRFSELMNKMYEDLNITPEERAAGKARAEKVPDKYVDSSYRSQPLEAELDKIAKESAGGKHIADRVRRFAEVQTNLSGKYANAIVEPIYELLGVKGQLTGTSEAAQRVLEYMDAQRYGKPLPTLTAEEAGAVKAIRAGLKLMHDDQRANGPYVMDASGTFRPPTDDPNYVPMSTSDDVMRTLHDNPNSPEARKLKQDFIDYMTAKGVDKPEAAYNRMFERIGAAREPDFNAVRFAEGVGLPESWLEKNPLKRFTKYANRFATDMAWYQKIQSDPRARDLLGIKDDGRGKAHTRGSEDSMAHNERISFLMRQITRDYPVSSVNFDAINRFIKSGMMQTATGIRDFITAPFIAMEGLKPSELPLIAKAYANIKQGIVEGRKAGVIKRNISAWEDFRQPNSKVTDLMDYATNAINKLSGREFLETITRGHQMALGKMVGESRMAEGDTTWFDKYGPEGWKTMPKDEVIDYAASRFVEDTQGTYDYRQLPRQALEGTAAPFLSLAKWSVGRLNTFNKNVIMEARKGNIQPLLMATVGAAFGGELVDQFNQLLTERKPEHLTWEEYMALDGKDSLYRWAAIASLSGYAGLASDTVKSVLDLANNTNARGLTFPLVDALTEGFTRVKQAGEAVQEGEENVVPKFFLQILKDNSQMLRVAMNREDAERKNKFRDLRVYERVEEGKLPSTTVEANPFMTSKRDFKRSTSLEEAGAMLPQLIEDAVSRSSKNGQLNVEGLRKELRGLKANSYRTMPSPDEMPQSFYGYLAWLHRTKGPEEANKVLTDFIQQRSVNKAKSEMVPSL